MQRQIQVVMTAIFLFFTIASFAVEQNSQQILNAELAGDISNLKHDMKSTESDVEILRRDQINYRLEKDILKEAYSSNLQSINIIITIVFGVFGILGYLGLKSIKDIKADYKNELNDLRLLKIGYETEFSELRTKQVNFEAKVGDLTKTNEEQDRRLKSLELLEKIARFLDSKNWEWAQRYAEIGIGFDPNNILLLGAKAHIHGKLGEFNLAIKTCSNILELEPDNATAIDMIEYLALDKQSEKFDEKFKQYLPKLEAENRTYLKDYLQTLNKLMNSEFETAITILNDVANKMNNDETINLGNWSFDDVDYVISKLDTGKQKILLSKAVQFFRGQINKQNFLASLSLEE